jgi:hypothetical protein
VHVLAAVLASATVSVGDPVVVHTTSVVGPKPVAIYLSNSVGLLRRVGTIARGKRALRFRLPSLAADVYAPAVTIDGRVVVGRGRLSVRAVPPPGFGPPGGPGCTPASPLRGWDVFGTAVGAQLWALFQFAGPVSGETIGYDGVVGKNVKIVFRMTSGVPTVFYAVAPDGRKVAPVSGPTAHTGSTWSRPGSEWGSQFVFDMPGCWRIHAGAAPAQGDVWLVVRS